MEHWLVSGNQNLRDQFGIGFLEDPQNVASWGVWKTSVHSAEITAEVIQRRVSSTVPCAVLELLSYTGRVEEFLMQVKRPAKRRSKLT
jgi:hypothetical protein